MTGGLQGVSLKGTLVAGETRLAFLEAAGSTVAVGIGQEIGGARVTRVESTWVGLRRGSQDFLLELESMKPPQSSPGASTLRPGDPTAQPLVSGAGTGAEGPVATGRLSLDEIRAQLDNPSRMAQEVRVVPKARDGQTYGVMLEFRKADNLMARLGLQHSDVLLAVNGSAIRGAEDLYRAYMTLRNAEALEFQVGPDTRHRGEALKDIPLKKGILISSINHRGHTVIPRGDSSFAAGDTVIVVAAGDEAISNLDDIFAD